MGLASVRRSAVAARWLAGSLARLPVRPLAKRAAKERYFLLLGRLCPRRVREIVKILVVNKLLQHGR